MDAAKQRALAGAAKRILADVAFNEVIEYLQVSAYAEFLATDSNESEIRESVYRKVNALNDIRATLRNLAQEAETGE
jgi:hypothetical protein